MIVKVKELISLAASPHLRDEYENTLLMLACKGKNKSLEVVEYLIEKGLYIDSKNTYNVTALMYATAYGNIEIVKYILRQKNIIDTKKKEDITMSMYTHKVLDYKEEIILKELRSLLGFAVFSGEKKLIDFILSLRNEIDINEANIDSAPFFFVTCSLESDNEIEKRVNRNIYRFEEYSINRIFSEIVGGHLEIVKDLVDDKKTDDKDEIKPQIAALENRHFKIVKYFVDKGENANTKNGLTLLLLASENGNLDLVKYLIEKGAKPNT